MRNERKRQELAARFAVADYGAKCAAYYAGAPGSGPDTISGTAEDAIKMADALLSALAIPPAAAPTLPAVPDSDEGGWSLQMPKSPGTYDVRSTLTAFATARVVVDDRDGGQLRATFPNGCASMLADSAWRKSMWRPVSAAPTAPLYVPKVGDVVTWGDRLCLYQVEEGGILRPCDKRHSRTELLAMEDVADLSPATDAECKAAGHRRVRGAADRAERRRTVGAIVRSLSGSEYIVVLPGLSSELAEQRHLTVPSVTACAAEGDVFVRWATRAECKLHHIPFVDRARRSKGTALEKDIQ